MERSEIQQKNGPYQISNNNTAHLKRLNFILYCSLTFSLTFTHNIDILVTFYSPYYQEENATRKT